MSIAARIPLATPHMGELERSLLIDAFDSNWIAPLGPQVDAFEAELAARVGVKNAVALSSGTAALHLALQLVGVGPGDEVLASTLTFAATVNPIVYLGASPVFIDSEARSWNMDPELLAAELRDSAARGKLPKAVVVVDLYGQCADYHPIAEACARYDVPLIEDAAEALGATYKGRSAGTFGTIGAFSFNGNKIITTSGGGMLVCDRKDLADRARFLATQARDPAPHYQHSTIGYNYRLSNLLAAVGRGQLKVLGDRVERKREIRAFYQSALGDIPGVNFMPESSEGRPTHWLTVIEVDPDAAGVDRESLRLALDVQNIEARPAWKPMHLQPVFAKYRSRGGDVAAKVFERGLCLPSGTALTRAELERVVATLRAAIPAR